MSIELVSPRCPVLIVDQSAESREVLQTALERRGLATLGTARTEVGLELARRHRPLVIVFDGEDRSDEVAAMCAAFRRESAGEPTSLVVLGVARHELAGVEHSEGVAKPYHYAPLIRKIEELCRQSMHVDSPS